MKKNKKMNVCVIQPSYSFEETDLQSRFDALLSLMEQCDESLDIIVLPEYSDALADVKGKVGFYDAVETYTEKLLNKAKETAKRCKALVFVNAGYKTENGIRNTTHAIDKEGNIVGRYFKAHPAPSEVKTDAEGGHELDVAYSYDFHEPYVLEIDGLRFGFLTCYDFYFYENYARMARENLDIIIGCSLQRTDTHEALSIINKFLCYQTNAYLIRASVSLGEDSKFCGSSMVISPKGEELLNMKSAVGLGVCEIDPNEKYYKPAGYLGKPKAHYEYIEEGRRPWLYRNGGASVALFDCLAPYPRICADVDGKRTMARFGEAVALGVDEIIVRVKKMDEMLIEGGIFLEKLLQKFAGRVIINIVLSSSDKRGVEKLSRLLRKYDHEKHAYITSEDVETLMLFKKHCENVARCLIGDNVAQAENLGVEKIWLSNKADAKVYEKAKERGLVVVSYAKSVKDGLTNKALGADCIITEKYIALEKRLER